MTFRTHLFCWSTAPGIGWLRILGRGIAWKDTRRYPLLFSERNGYTRRWLIGPWSFKLLKKEPA